MLLREKGEKFQETKIATLKGSCGVSFFFLLRITQHNTTPPCLKA
jgi:hypothetical protein